MLFSAKAEYACLAMLELAVRSGDARPARLTDLAEKHGIPQRFLVQILLQLKGARLVDSVRGAAGGYTLARRPQFITLAEVIAVVDPPDRTPRLGRDGKQSRLAGPPTSGMTVIRDVWKEVDAAQKRVLDAVTLADLVTRAERTNGIVYEI
jgi:Rrf2 family transcriptional regulator, cysteine metabolism repressor